MSKVLIITGRVYLGKKGSSEKETITDILEKTEIDLATDKRLSKADVDRIIRSGAGHMKADPPKAPEPEALDPERLKQLTDAIDLLEAGNEAHWTSTGLPEVAALKELTDTKVSGAERDAAWAEHQAA